MITSRIYPAPTAPLSAADLPPGAEIVDVRTADGLDLKGVAVAARAGMPTLLVFHGNASSASGTAAWFAPLLDKGYGLVAAGYRGYSSNPGTPSESGLAADADAFFAAARSRAGAGPLIVVGHSLGGGVALGLSRRHRLDAVLTIGTFTRMRAMAPRVARALVPDGYRNETAVSVLDAPFYLAHGSADPVVPIAHGEQLHKAAGKAGKRGMSFVIMGGGHAPDGTLIAAVMDVVASDLRTGTIDIPGLPPAIKVIPFGQVQPLNP